MVIESSHQQQQQQQKNNNSDDNSCDDNNNNNNNDDNDHNYEYNYEEDLVEDLEEDQQPTLFKLSGVNTSNLNNFIIEECITKVLLSSMPMPMPSSASLLTVTLLEKDYEEAGTILFCVNHDNYNSNCNDNDNDNDNVNVNVNVNVNGNGLDNEVILQMIRAYVSSLSTSIITCTTTTTDNKDWIVESSEIEIYNEEMEEEENVEYITEEEAYQLWLEQNKSNNNGDDDGVVVVVGGNDDDNTSLVCSPDGNMIMPSHNKSINNKNSNTNNNNNNNNKNGSVGSVDVDVDVPAACHMMYSNTTLEQFERDPGLFEFDNVPRVHYKEFLLSRQHHLSSNKKNSNNNDSTLSTSKLMKDFGNQPIIFYGLSLDDDDENESSSTLLDFQHQLRESIRSCGEETIVRTGNRETLIQNGFHNSIPATFNEVINNNNNNNSNNNNSNNSGSNNTIIFNPINELPSEFHTKHVLGRWLMTDDDDDDDDDRLPSFPNSLWKMILGSTNSSIMNSIEEKADQQQQQQLTEEEADQQQQLDIKFTLCIANEGFGIGMHKHGPALFFLTEGLKKWYMSEPKQIDDIITLNQNQNQNQYNNNNNNTHPKFYNELSNYKCIQKPGELLYVPNLWYHEIYNLSSPTIGIQGLGSS